MVGAVPGVESAQTPDSSIRERLQAWRVAATLFAHHPILGVGVGNFDLYYREEVMLLGGETRRINLSAHSIFLEVAAERGLVGVIAFLGLLGAAAGGLLRAHRMISSAQSVEEASLVAAFGCGLLGYLAALLFLHDAFPQFFWLAMTFAIAMPRIVAAGRRSGTRHRRRGGRRRKRSGTAPTSSGSDAAERPLPPAAQAPAAPASEPARREPPRPSDSAADRAGRSRARGRALSLTRLSRLAWQARKRAHSWSYASGAPKQILMIVGCQRSGTTMMQTVFENDLEAEVYGEFSRLSGGAGDPLRLRRLDEVREAITASRFPFIVMKPLVESQRISALLDAFPEARALWMYRHYNDVASSNLRRFGRQNGIRDLEPIVAGRVDDWRAEAVADEVRSLLARHFDQRMNPYDAAALFWYARNSHFFRQDLDREPRVLLVEYDAFVRAPVAGIERIYAFLDRPPAAARAVAQVEHRRSGSSGSVQLSREVDELCREFWEALEAVRLAGERPAVKVE
jgi:hypothetical protein